MAGRLTQFVKKTKDKKDEEARRNKELVDKALALVPRCELNDSLPEDASPEDLWKAVHKNFQWNFGPSKGKSLADTKTQFLKWAFRKLKDPVRSICHVELMMREKKWIDEPSAEAAEGAADPAADQSPAENTGEAADQTSTPTDSE